MATGLEALFSQKFPYQSGPCHTHQSPNLYIWGNVQVSTHGQQSALYLVGEIYNLRSLGQGLNQPIATWNDAEILHELVDRQGTAIISQCNGRFFVVHHHIDEHTFEVFNDQMGIQQLYSHQYAGGIIMASELKFMLAHPRCPRSINWQQSIRRSLGFQLIDHCQHQNAWFTGVEMLPPANRIRIQARKNDIQMPPIGNQRLRLSPTKTPGR